MKLERIRTTEIGTALKCEKQLYYRRTQPKPEKTPVYLFIGSVVHSVLEAHFRAKAEDGVGLRPDAQKRLFEAEFEKGAVSADFSKLSQDRAKAKAWGYVETYLRERGGVLIPQNAETIELPLQFVVKRDDQELLITGKVDMVAKGGVIIDHKTGRLLNPENEVQPYLYFTGLKANGYDVKGFQFNVVNDKGVQVFDVPFNQGKADELINFALRLQTAWEEDNLLYATRDWVCNFCEFKSVCEKNP